ncbi:Sugar lactone lactonase YvrE [Verrucomicrobium sp. GAS474]|uniref:hypothetical protein n=1 Tax=Verrucomicrobium sp. GAS474 TaxID=1882831 RepID=UPI00087D075A|nr:hypothetical protein [Verrucomicrobium sp. GAS474]SDU08623.1 Sugar lactone lactonase YvrE [Verrucomicrobium sp. GAS474]
MKTRPPAPLGLSLALLLLSLSPLALHAEHLRELVYDSYAGFSDGTNRGTALSDEGVLSSAPSLGDLVDLSKFDADQIWAVLPVGSAYYVGTAPKGDLFRVSAGGAVERAATFKESHVYALAKNGKNEVFAATSPDGKIYKVGGGGKSEVWFEPKEKYIWALAFDKDGNLYAATGTNGKIYKITGQNKGAVFASTDEVHIRSLAFDGKGGLLAGSAESGILYRVATDGSFVALASTGAQEINQIVPAADGAVWFSTVGKAKSPAAKSGGDDKEKEALLSLLAKSGLPSLKRGDASGGDGDDAKASRFPVVAGVGGSRVWRFDAASGAQPLWVAPVGEPVLALALSPSPDGNGIVAGTGGEGYLYRIDLRGRATRLLKLDGMALSTVTPLDGSSQPQYLLGGSHPAFLKLVGGPRRDAAFYESGVLDAGSFTTWGAVRAEGEGTFRIETRSGNTPKPDASWYPWTALRENRSVSPAARYFQYRLDPGANGSVTRVSVSYLPKNLPPRISRIALLDPGVGYLSVPPAPQPPQAKTADQIYQDVFGSGMRTGSPSHYQPVFSRGYRTAVWRAVDPNGDTLLYSLSCKAEGEKEWRLLAKELNDPVFSWDTTGWPDGRYRLKVTASDKPSNPDADALADTLVGSVFLIDNTAPEIRVESGRARAVAFTVTDEASGIASISVSKDGNDFKDLVPVENTLDPRKQSFRYELKEGEVLYIRAEDQSGNVASFLVKP